MHSSQPIIPHTQATGLADPTQGALDHPAYLPQTTAVGHPGGGQMVLDPSLPQPSAVTRRAVRPIAIELARFAARAPAGALEGRNRIQRGQSRQRIRALRTGKGERPRGPAALDDEVPFGAFFRAIRGIFTRQGPPKSARIAALSMTALSQSILSSRLNRSRSACSTFFHTPRRCHARIRRQQVTPDPQPISWGSISHGMPLLRTKTMPVRQARASTGGRPRFPGRALGRGSRGSMIAQSSSGTRGSAITISRNAVVH